MSVIYDDDGIPVMPADAEMYAETDRDADGYTAIVSVVGASGALHRVSVMPMTHYMTRAAAQKRAEEWLTAEFHRHRLWDYAHTNDALLRQRREIDRHIAKRDEA